MNHDWHELTDITGDRPFVVTSVRLRNGVAIEGEFELPAIARLRYEDQVFVSAFVANHGSIKDMERAFGISYPTVKNRLNRIAKQLELVVDAGSPAETGSRPASSEAGGHGSSKEDVLGMLERGEIGASEAAERLKR